MSLKTRFGNLGNVYDEDPSPDRVSCSSRARADHRPTSRRSSEHFGGEPAARSTAPSTAGRRRHALRDALERIRAGGRGGGARRLRDHLILTDEGVGPDRVADPDDPGHRARSTATWSARACAPSARSIVRARRVPRRPLFRGADRRRRDGGQRLSGRGRDRRPPRARPVPGPRPARPASIASRRRSTRACSR